MKRLGWGVAALALLGLTLTAVTTAAGEDELAKGGQAFLDAKCNMCHAVSSAGIEAKTASEKMLGPDLVGLDGHDSLADAGALAKYIKQETELDGAKHKKGFKGTDEELQALVDWLLEQKAE